MKLTLLIAIFFVILITDAKSEMLLAFPADTPLVGFKGNPRFFFTFDNTTSIVGGKPAGTNELKLGLEFKKKLKLGVGYGLLVSDVVEEKSVKAVRTGNDSTLNAQLSLSFFSVNAEYVYYKSKRLQIASPLTIGLGSSYFRYYEKNREGSFVESRTDEGGVLIITASGMATYRVLRWFGASAGLGYRLAVVNNDNIQESFNSPVFVFKLRLFFSEIYKSVFPRGITGKRNPPYSNEYWD